MTLFFILRAYRLVHGNHLYQPLLPSRKKLQINRKHLHLDVSNLWYGKPSCSCMQAFKREKYYASGQHLHLLYFRRRILKRFILTETKSLSLGLQQCQIQHQRTHSSRLCTTVVWCWSPVRKNSMQTLKITLIYYMIISTTEYFSRRYL